MELKNNTLLRDDTYRILKKLGQGSFGITYLAEHTALGKKVAIKEFYMKDINSRSDDGSITGITDGSFSYTYGQKFKREAINLAKLEHPNIVRVTDCFDENSTYYYVMDFVEGENLNDYLKSHTVSENEAVGIVKDVARALTYMHDQHHMLHLDLKPGNIMRRASDGHIFLIDFGLSKHYSNDGQPETSTSIGLGTPGYAPIEQGNQARGGEFRPTIDVYALGATLYKLLTGETPPAASDVLADEQQLSNKLKQKGISQSVTNLVMEAMDPVAKKRIPTVNEFSKRLAESDSIPLLPKSHSIPPIPKSHTIPPIPKSHTIPPIPKSHSIPPIPKSHSIPPIPKSHSIPPIPKSHSIPPIPKSHSIPPIPKSHSIPPIPKSHSIPPIPKSHTIPPIPKEPLDFSQDNENTRIAEP